MPFILTPDVELTRDRNQRVRALEHFRQPYLLAAGARGSLAGLGDAYLAEVAPLYEIGVEELQSLDERDAQLDRKQRERLVRVDVAPLPDGSGTVVYAQRLMNLDVWEAGIAVSILANPLRVVSSRSTYHHDIKVANADVLAKPIKPAAALLGTALGISSRQRQALRIMHRRVFTQLRKSGPCPNPATCARNSPSWCVRSGRTGGWTRYCSPGSLPTAASAARRRFSATYCRAINACSTWRQRLDSTTCPMPGERFA